MRKNRSTNDIKINYYKKDNFEEKTLKEIKEDNNNKNDDDNEEGKLNYYENILKKPKTLEKKNQSLILPKNMYNNIKNKISVSVKRGKIVLPSINTKK